MAWHLVGGKSLSEPKVVRLPTHIWVSQPQWVHSSFRNNHKYYLMFTTKKISLSRNKLLCSIWYFSPSSWRILGCPINSWHIHTQYKEKHNSNLLYSNMTNVFWPGRLCQRRNTVWCHYDRVSFLKNPYKIHLIARPLGRDMGCILWVQALICIMSHSL